MAYASLQEIDAFIDQEWESYLTDLASLIRIDSSLDSETASEGAPFGVGPRAALDGILAIAQRMGLETHDGEGYAGYADLIAQGPSVTQQQVGVIGHVDVVPAGEGWHFPPFELTRKEGMLIGRGVTDDKGPVLCALYALKFWIDKNISLRHTIRFIFGCNEETGMDEVPYYKQHYGSPDFLFTPDADFPLCYGEKGLFGVTITQDVPTDELIAFEGGSATNAVPAFARAVVRKDAALLTETDGITIEPLECGVARVEAAGISGHASLPEGTVNALGVLARYLLRAGVGSNAERSWLDMLARMANFTDGSVIGIAAHDEDFGALTSVVGTARKDDDHLSFTVDIRFPLATTGEALTSAFEDMAASQGAQVCVTRNQEPFIVDPHTKAVQALLGAYTAATGLQAEPFTMGGATYAREFPHAVSFGPAEEGIFDKPSWVGGMHGADEGTSEEELKRALRIYIQAFGGLAEVDDVSAQ